MDQSWDRRLGVRAVARNLLSRRLRKSEELAYASRQVTTIEINATYYRTQSPIRFAAGPPPCRRISSSPSRRTALPPTARTLPRAARPVTRFLESGLTELGLKLGPLLWQFAPTKKFNADEIELFFASLPARARRMEAAPCRRGPPCEFRLAGLYRAGTPLQYRDLSRALG